MVSQWFESGKNKWLGDVLPQKSFFYARVNANRSKNPFLCARPSPKLYLMRERNSYPKILFVQFIAGM